MGSPRRHARQILEDACGILISKCWDRQNPGRWLLRTVIERCRSLASRVGGGDGDGGPLTPARQTPGGEPVLQPQPTEGVLERRPLGTAEGAVSISTSWTSASRAAPRKKRISSSSRRGGGGEQEDGGDPLGRQAVRRPQARARGRDRTGTGISSRTVTECRRSSSASSSSSPRMRGEAVVTAISSPSPAAGAAAGGSPPAPARRGAAARAEDDRLAAEGGAAHLALDRRRRDRPETWERGRRAGEASLGESCYALFTPTA